MPNPRVVRMDEMWKDVKDFPNYVISSHGRVYNRKTNRELSPYEVNGYLQVQLWRDRFTKYFYVHRLVASHFLTGWTARSTVGWRDNDTRNNRIENLYFKGTSRLGHIIESEKVITERRLEIVETGQSFMTVKACARFLNTSPQGIYQVLTGRRLSHLGYHFRWIDI